MVIRGKVCQVVGHGGMNMHIINITGVPDARVRLCAACLTQRACSVVPTHTAVNKSSLLHITHAMGSLHACKRLCLL